MTIVAFIIFILVIVVCGSAASSSGNSSSNNIYDDYPYDSGERGSFSHSSSNQRHRESFEEADSYYDRDGNEHCVDDYGYCEDCDDYHDF